jgi:hypothetical protein
LAYVRDCISSNEGGIDAGDFGFNNIALVQSLLMVLLPNQSTGSQNHLTDEQFLACMVEIIHAFCFTFIHVLPI